MANDATGARFGELYALACAFAARIDLDELVPLVVAECRRALDAEGASVLLLDPATNELYFEASADDPAVAVRLRGLRLPADRGIAGAVLQSEIPIRVDDVATDPRFYAAVDRQTGFTLLEAMAGSIAVAFDNAWETDLIAQALARPAATQDEALRPPLEGRHSGSQASTHAVYVPWQSASQST
jgi:hypothetical protein